MFVSYGFDFYEFFRDDVDSFAVVFDLFDGNFVCFVGDVFGGNVDVVGEFFRYGVVCYYVYDYVIILSVRILERLRINVRYIERGDYLFRYGCDLVEVVVCICGYFSFIEDNFFCCMFIESIDDVSENLLFGDERRVFIRDELR